MTPYEDSASVAEARARYFEENGFVRPYESPWVTLRVGPVPFAFPNTAARVRAVRLHDLHHVATGYDTTWTGEAEIGAWEIASGCAHHLPAWLLNLAAHAIGLFIAPRALFRAFVRGRHSRNLYAGEFHEALLRRTVGELRADLRLDREPPPATFRDVTAFALWSGIGLMYALAVPVLVALLLVWSW